MAKKRKYIKQAFESAGVSSDVSANLYLSMLVSPAWQALTANQQRLYLYCKLQYYAERQKPRADDPLTFTMNRGKWCTLYHLYTAGNARSFYRDMSELISRGCVSCVESGACTRTKSVYRFSAKWRDYGTPDFKILPTEMTSAMRKELLKSAEKKPPA